MKKIFFILVTAMLYKNSIAQTVNNVTDVYNKETILDSLQGTKLLIVVLPSQTDTAMNNQLLRFQKAFAKKVKVVGLVSVQAGESSKESYAAAYTEASRLGMIVTEGISVNEKADNERASVIQWMTTRSNNRRQDRYAIGAKFFLSEDGRVYAQLGKETSLDDPLVKCILNTKVPATKMIRETSGELPVSDPKIQNP